MSEETHPVGFWSLWNPAQTHFLPKRVLQNLHNPHNEPYSSNWVLQKKYNTHNKPQISRESVVKLYQHPLPRVPLFATFNPKIPQSGALFFYICNRFFPDCIALGPPLRDQTTFCSLALEPRVWNQRTFQFRMCGFSRLPVHMSYDTLRPNFTATVHRNNPRRESEFQEQWGGIWYKGCMRHW